MTRDAGQRPAVVRVATRADIPEMHRIRLAVRENRLTTSVVTEASYSPEIETTGRGWVSVEDGTVRGFAVGNRVNGNIWALFVDPDHEGCGHGRALHDTMVEWLQAQGLPRLWLTTGPDTRARRFYEKAGWTLVRPLPPDEVLMERYAGVPLGH